MSAATVRALVAAAHARGMLAIAHAGQIEADQRELARHPRLGLYLDPTRQGPLRSLARSAHGCPGDRMIGAHSLTVTLPRTVG